MKNIGIIVNSIGYGGNERSAVNIAKALKPFYNVFIITQENNGNHYGYQGTVIDLNTPCAKTRVGKVINALRRIILLKRVIKRKKINSLLIILPVSNPINYLRYRCKKIVSCRDCGDLKRRTDKYIKMTEQSDFIICNSEMMSSMIKEYRPSLSNKVKTIYNILDTNKITQLIDEPINDKVLSFAKDKKIVVSMGRLVTAKGFNNLIKAFYVLSQKEDDVRLILMGSGELKEKIVKLIHELAIDDRVMILEFQENPFHIINASNVFVLSSFYEGFPNVLVEAMSCGQPVVATDCPSGPAEILETTVDSGFNISNCGVLIEYITENESSWDCKEFVEQHYSMADAIYLLLNNSELSNKLSKQASERVKDFSEENIVHQWISVLGE